MGTWTRIACGVELIRRYPGYGLVSHFATFAGIKVPSSRVIDGRDLAPVLKGETKFRSCPGHEEIIECGRSIEAFLNRAGNGKRSFLDTNTTMPFFITEPRSLVRRALAQLEDVFEPKSGTLRLCPLTG